MGALSWIEEAIEKEKEKKTGKETKETKSKK
jgi:hypothetical protein